MVYENIPFYDARKKVATQIFTRDSEYFPALPERTNSNNEELYIQQRKTKQKKGKSIVPPSDK